MSGHSKWSTIKHKKGAADAKLAVMEECGFTITRNPSEMGKLLKALLK